MWSKNLETILKQLKNITPEELKELENWYSQAKAPLKRLILPTIALAIVGLSGCSTSKSPESDPAYISPNHYSDYNCKQLSAEKQRVSSKLEQMSGGSNDVAGQVLNTALSAFAISRGYSIGGDDNTAYRRLYNQYEVLEQTAIEKECF